MVFRRFFAGILLGGILGVLPISYVFHVVISEEQVFAACTEDISNDSSNGTLQKCCGNSMVPINTICLLEGIPGGSSSSSYSITVSPGAPFAESGIFKYLKGGGFQWILNIGIGICVLNGTLGGIKIVMSGLDGSGTEEGKTKMIWSIVGIVIFLLAGAILRYINPVGFIL